MPLTNIQYDEIMRSYEKKNLERQHLIESRRGNIERLSPGFGQIDRDIASLSVSGAKAVLDGDSKKAEEFKKRRRELSGERIRILRSLGFSADYLDPPYDCPYCKDTGYIGNKRCSCLVQASLNMIYEQSNLSDVLEKENFQTFSFDYYSRDIIDGATGMSSFQAAKMAYERCLEFAKTFEKTHENIFIFGDTGVGKTFLANAAAKELLDKGYSVIYFSAQRLFELLAKEAFGKDGEHADIQDNIFDCDLLIIDDLGTELTNSFTSSRLFLCLNERIRKKKSTFISSNLQLQDIASVYSERVFSRISDSFTLLHLFGNDIRIQKKLGNA